MRCIWVRAEFVASEALYHLGVPTTRALSLVGTGAEVVRDMFYKCAPQLHPPRLWSCACVVPTYAAHWLEPTQRVCGRR